MDNLEFLRQKNNDYRQNMKYRRLTSQELETLEKEFVQFLASNHITASDWVKLKNTNLEKVEQLIGIFSDIVLEQTLKKLKYLEFISAKDIKTFYCGIETIHLLGLRMKETASYNFLELALPNELLDLLEKSSAELEVYSAKKSYKNSREEELFQMLEQGCLISKEGEMFKLLKALKS